MFGHKCFTADARMCAVECLISSRVGIRLVCGFLYLNHLFYNFDFRVV